MVRCRLLSRTQLANASPEHCARGHPQAYLVVRFTPRVAISVIFIHTKELSAGSFGNGPSGAMCCVRLALRRLALARRGRVGTKLATRTAPRSVGARQRRGRRRVLPETSS